MIGVKTVLLEWSIVVTCSIAQPSVLQTFRANKTIKYGKMIKGILESKYGVVLSTETTLPHMERNLVWATHIQNKADNVFKHRRKTTSGVSFDLLERDEWMTRGNHQWMFPISWTGGWVEIDCRERKNGTLDKKMEDKRVLLVEENLGWLTQMSFHFLTYLTMLVLSVFFFLEMRQRDLDTAPLHWRSLGCLY